MRSHAPPKMAPSEITRHLLMQRVRARERGFGLRILAMTSSGVATHFPRFGSCSKLSNAVNADCFDDIIGFLVFFRISRFGLFKTQ